VDSPRIRIPRDNRSLVERVFHPEAREGFVDENPDWEVVRNEGDGKQFGLDTLVNMAGLRLSDQYHEQSQAFEQAAVEKIRTRIGDDRIAVLLTKPVHGWYSNDSCAHTVDLPLRQVHSAGGVDLKSPVATWLEDTENGPVYSLGQRGRLLYTSDGWQQFRND